MADATPAPPPGGDQNRGISLLEVGWIECFLAVIIVGLRLYTRVKYTRKLWWDDWVMLLTLFFVITYTVFWTVYNDQKGGHHVYYLTLDEQITALKLNWISQPFEIMAIGTGKVSVALLLLRVLGPKNRYKKWFLWFLIASTLTVCAIGIIFTFAQCQPVARLWNPTVEGHCLDPMIQANEALVVGSYLTAVDFVLAIVPAMIVWDLQLSVKKKIGLAFLMGMGVFAGVCAAIKTSKLPELGARSDFTWITIELLIWNGNEIFTIIVAACIPTLRPLFLDLTGKLTTTMRYGKSGNKSGAPNSLKLNKLSDNSGSRKLPSHYGSHDTSMDDEYSDSKTLPIRQTTEWSVDRETIPGDGFKGRGHNMV